MFLTPEYASALPSSGAESLNRGLTDVQVFILALDHDAMFKETEGELTVDC